jgi:GAF domain-containing protein
MQIKSTRAVNSWLKMLRNQEERYQLAAFFGVTAEQAEWLNTNYADPNPGSLLEKLISERRTVHAQDVQNEFPFSASASAISSQAALGVPLLREGELIGTLVLHREEKRGFTREQIGLIETFADQAVIAINNVDLFQEVQARSKALAQSVEELRSLGEVGQAVSSSLDKDKVLNTVLENACKMARAGGGTIYVYDKAANAFRLEAGYNMSEEHIARVRAQPMRMGDPVVGESVERRETIVIEDLSAIDRTHTPLIDILVRAGVRAILSMPLIHQGEVIGALVVRRSYPGPFALETVKLLENFATQSAIAVNNARLFAEIQDKSRQLELASQHKSQFVANMSHELRTPLAAILGYAELMQEGFYGEPSPKSMDALTRIAQTASTS